MDLSLNLEKKKKRKIFCVLSEIQLIIKRFFSILLNNLHMQEILEIHFELFFN
jgi:hypothetical protein